MWSRRHFLETLSTVPLGGIAITDVAPASLFDSTDLATSLGAPQTRAPQLPASTRGPDVYARIGVRPFINEHGNHHT